MAKFLLFAGERFYAQGGWSDLVGSFDEIETAKAEGRRLIKLTGMEDPDWWHVVDADSGAIVAGNRAQGWGADDLPATIADDDWL